MEKRNTLLLLLLLSGFVVSVSSGVTDGGGGGGRGSRRNRICRRDPPDCDGVGIMHLPLSQTLSFTLDGWWDLKLDSQDNDLKPQVSSKRVNVGGHVSLTRVSECRVKVVLQNSSFSDAEEMNLNSVEAWVVVSGGDIRAVCARNGDAHPASPAVTHAFALARSVMSASLNLAPFVDKQNEVIKEQDHLGLCETQYQTKSLGPGLQELKRTRDLGRCINYKDKSQSFDTLSHLTNKAVWECRHLYQYHRGIETADSVTVKEADEAFLSKVECFQSINLPETANFSAELNLTLVDMQDWNAADEPGGIQHELDLSTTVLSPAAEVDSSAKVRQILNNLCSETRRAVTPKAFLLYSQLVFSLMELPKNVIIQLYREIFGGSICSEHKGVERLFVSALRDTATGSAAAAKCQLMASGRAEFSRLWMYSLGNVQRPSPESLRVCSQLLEGSHWKDSVLGVAAMTGQAVRKSCRGEKSYHCNFDNPGCARGNSRCSMGQAVQDIVNNMAAHLASCSSRGSEQNQQLLFAIRGLGNIGAFGYDVENSLMTCGGIHIDPPVRVATLEAIRYGSCSLQVTNWLKWQVLNETEKSELRITAFQSLHFCYPEEAEAVALLITEKESDTQVKSYVSAYVLDDGGKPGDARQYSRHMVTNLTSVMGLPDTLLETDVIFQNSFMPQSVAFNLSSVLLRQHGGSVQFGGRVENLEEVMQAIFGHEGAAGSTLTEWMETLLHKAQELFSEASEDFVENHERDKRSYDVSDVKNLLKKVKKQVLTELKGWVYAGVSGSDHYFNTFSVDPLALEWEELLENWLEQFFEASYSFLINSNEEVSAGWTPINEKTCSWSIIGFPITVYKQEGGIIKAAASSHVNLLSLLRNPYTSTLDVGVSASTGKYSVSCMSLTTLFGNVKAEYSGVRTNAFDINAILKIQGSDSAELKIDIPQDSFQGDASQFVRSLSVPSLNEDIGTPQDELNEEDIENFMNAETRCADVRDGNGGLTEHNKNLGTVPGLVSKRHCETHFENVLGLSARSDSQLVLGQHMAVVQIRNYIEKSEDGITGYSIGFSAKNPGINSLFLDMHIEAEGASAEQKAGLVFGLTYSPHFTIKVLLHSQQFSASGEVSLVNDPNLKRLEGHVSFGSSTYGFKGELLMVRDGGQVSVKPRLVISYPGQQEDALLEGYIAQYLSEKVSSLTLDLFTEGTLKQYLDVALKGTAEYRAPKGRTKVLALKNIHLATPHFSLGLESMLSFNDEVIDGKVQATWDGQVVVLDGSVTDLGSGQDDKHFVVNLQLLLPDHPHIDTKITCDTQVHASELTNNITLVIGEGDTQREFEVFHSTSWSITHPVPTNFPSIDSSSVYHSSHPHSYGNLAARIENKLKVTCLAANLNWDIDHVIQIANKSVENLILAQLGDQNHKIMSNLYDQSEEFFKYHMEIEISFPAWHFSYVDTLQQRPEGDMIGQSTTVMPSGRVYSTSSRMYKSTANSRIIFEMSYDVLVREGSKVWKIVLQESFDWSLEHMHIQCSAEVGDKTVFGLELALDGISSGEIEFHVKNWMKDMYEGEITLSSEGRKTDFNLDIIIIPINREIKSKLALGHDGCAVGLMDGEFAWDVRGDASRTVTLSSVIQLPKDGQALELKGSMSVLTWTWKTELIVNLGRDIGDNHHMTYILVLPDDSKLEIGSQLDFSVGENDVSLSTIFEVQMPNAQVHNMSLVAKGLLSGRELTDAVVTFDVQSPVTDEVHFHLHVKTEKEETRKIIGVKLKTNSEANYWEPVEGEAKGVWDGTSANFELEATMGVTSINIDTSGSYKVDGDEHNISGYTEVKLPSGKAWRQLKASLTGSFSVGHNPGRLKVAHDMNVEKDHQEIFHTNGEVSVHVPKAEGKLVISHAGNVASYQEYILEGTFTGKELEVEIEGLVDEMPVKVSLHYIDGQEVTVKAFYQTEDNFSVSVKTELKDIGIGIRKATDTSYSLTTEGLLVYRGRRTRLNHELSITPSQGSSMLRLSPVLGNVFELTTIRTKYSNHHWSTVISLDWGQRRFNYHDDIYFPSYSECIIKIEIDAPDLNITKVTAKVEAAALSSGEQAVQVKYLVQNDTVHSARFMYYIHGTEDEMIWRAGARDLVLSTREYSDLLLSHAMTLPTGGMEIKSNMTVGIIPIVGVGVTVTPHTRALLLSVCTTSEECVRLRAHAHARRTPSTRTYSVAAHALNSLFWNLPEDSLVQNSVTFSAQETSDKVMVTGGIRRVMCDQVTCENFVVRGVLHATLQVTDDDFEILLDTTNRTMKFRSIMRNSLDHEIAPATLPGGRLVRSSTLETQLWMNVNKDPQGMINWNSTVIQYASSRAKEWVIHSGVHHKSFGKVLRLGGKVIAEPTAARLLMLIDVFSELEDALEFNLELLQDRGNHIMIANLTKKIEPQPRIVDVVVSFLPSPDSGEVSVVLIIPLVKDGHIPIQNSQPNLANSETHFTLTCGLDSPHKDTTISCRLITPSVDEKVYMKYQMSKDVGCKGLVASLGILHHNYQALQKSCHNPNSFQASLSTKTEKVQEKELAVKLGVLDTRKAELDLMDAIHILFKLHPPFLLHAMAHSRGNIWSRWEDFKADVKIELSELLSTAKSVSEALESDMRVLGNLARVSAPSPAHRLARYTHAQSDQLLEELEGDELIKELSHSAQMCIDVTSVLFEAGMAYLNHNYGSMILELGIEVVAWLKTAVKNVGYFVINTGKSISNTFNYTWSFTSSIPWRALDYASTLPVIADGVKWIIVQVDKVQGSYIYGAATEAVVTIGQYINRSLSLVYPVSEYISNGEWVSGSWNIWVPLPECSHSLLDVWNILSGASRTSKHRMSLTTAVHQWWHLLTHPSQLIDYFSPPFPAHGTVIGETNFVSLDGRTFALNSSCSYILLTDVQDELFTLVSELQNNVAKRSYTLFLGETAIEVQPDLQVTIDGDPVTLPHTSDTISITRNLQHLTVATYDDLGRDLISLTCWTYQNACVISVSGWLHADTGGLLGHLNLDPADDLMRPSGQIALSGDVFSESWQIGTECSAGKTIIEIPSSTRAHHLCRKFLLDFSSPAYPCQDNVDVVPYYETCIRYLSSLEEEKSGSPTPQNYSTNNDDEQHLGPSNVHRRSLSQRANDSGIEDVYVGWNNTNVTDFNTTENSLDGYSSISLQINVRDLIFPFANSENDLVDATNKELDAICNVMAAYFALCKAKDIRIALPPICGSASKLTYNEPMSSDVRQLDLVILVDENSCDSFLYEHLVRPIPDVLERIAHGKNISDVKMAAIGYGAGGGNIIYHIPGPSLLTSASQLKLSQPHSSERSRGSLLQGLRAVSNFPFRPGSARVVLNIRCSSQDLPQFTETLPKEMMRRRLTLFTLTPDLLVFNPTRPKAVRNTIGVDRWRVYSLRHDKQKSVDSWGVRRPDSNIAKLAMKSGGGVFTVTPLRDEPRAGYYMKLFRKVLSRAVMKTVNNAYNRYARNLRDENH